MGHMSDEEAEDLGWSDRFAMEQEEDDRVASLVEEVERLREALQGAIGALEFSRDYHRDLGNEEQSFAQDKLDAALKALEKPNA